MIFHWDKLITKVFGEGTKIKFPLYFPSKKNQVTLLNMEKYGEKFTAVAKFFVWGDPEIEWKILTKASEIGINTPRPICKQKNVIFTEFIPGKTFNYIAGTNPGSLPVEALGKWLAQFHKAFDGGNGKVHLKGDGMMPNFLLGDNQEIYGLDFEESRIGLPVEDLGYISASIISIGGVCQNARFIRVQNFLHSYKQENPIPFDENLLKNTIIQQLEEHKIFMKNYKDEIESNIKAIANIPLLTS